MWTWCPPSFRVKKKWIIRKSVGNLVNAGSAHVPFLLKRWNEVFFCCFCLLFVCFLRQGLSMQPRLILGSWYSSCLSLGHHAQPGVGCFVSECMCVCVRGPWQVSYLCHCYHYFYWYFVCILQGVQGGSFACIYDCAIYMLPPTFGDQNRTLDPLELELEVVPGHYVGAGNWTQVPWKSSQCSWPPSHLFSPSTLFLRQDLWLKLVTQWAPGNLPISVSQLWDCTCMLGFLHEC